ncbi:MAG: hypothetical protein EHM58_13305 [Ignavibacteriae bacterium]|nr:MAG: hypothetical protein EHM58_13305 [Ignavibacteriota bacterium]
MKTNIYQKIVLLLAFVLLNTTFAGCEVIADIFKAGFWIGIIAVVIIIIIVMAIIRMLRR